MLACRGNSLFPQKLNREVELLSIGKSGLARINNFSRDFVNSLTWFLTKII